MPKADLTPEDAVRYAVNVTKLAMPRDALKAAEDEGGRFTSEEIRAFARRRLDARATDH